MRMILMPIRINSHNWHRDKKRPLPNLRTYPKTENGVESSLLTSKNPSYYKEILFPTPHKEILFPIPSRAGPLLLLAVSVQQLARLIPWPGENVIRQQ